MLVRSGIELSTRLLYGFLKLDGVLVLIVNGIDAIFQFIYGTLFLIYFSVG